MHPTVHALTLRERMRKWFKLFIVVSLISLGLQAAGCGTKGWIVWRYIVSGFNGGSVGKEYFLGLWAVKYCDASTDICVTTSLGELDQLTQGVVTMLMLEFQVEVCLALVLLTIFTVMLLVCFFSDCKLGILRGIVYCMIFLTLASGILALVASGRFGDAVRTVHELSLPRSPYAVPYSVILTGVGGILACLQALVMLPTLKPWQHDPETRASAYVMDSRQPRLARGGRPGSHHGQYPSEQPPRLARGGRPGSHHGQYPSEQPPGAYNGANYSDSYKNDYRLSGGYQLDDPRCMYGQYPSEQPTGAYIGPNYLDTYRSDYRSSGGYQLDDPRYMYGRRY